MDMSDEEFDRNAEIWANVIGMPNRWAARKGSVRTGSSPDLSTLLL